MLLLGRLGCRRSEGLMKDAIEFNVDGQITV